MNAVIPILLLLVQADEPNLRVLEAERGKPAPSKMLSEFLAHQAHDALDRRRAKYESLKTVDDCTAYQKRMREFFTRQLGGFPERSPLNAKVVGKLAGDGYRVEKIIYESRPHHHVTAALYLPDSTPPYPAVLIACGHSKSGKAAGYNQRIGILLAQNGLAAMCYDPIGQGERSQILAEDGNAKYRNSTTEHFLVGVGSILLGTNTAQYRTYDGIRGIDYLVSRSDIDGRRIGCTGCSGGGTLTSYIMALDDRVTCAAPACYLTTFRRLIDTIGPQDAEQNIFGQVAHGMDHPDYILLRAPKPTLISATTRDFFDIDGTWDTFRQAKRIYTRFGYPERIDLVEDDSKHGVTKHNREAIARWMRRWLLEIDEAVTDSKSKVWSEQELQCTPDGQVLSLPDEKSVFEINVEWAIRLAKARTEATPSKQQFLNDVRRVSRIRPLDELAKPKIQTVETIRGDGHRIEKIVIRPKKGILLTALRFIPDRPAGDAYLYLHGEGKQTDTGKDGAISKLVAQGHEVLAVDLSGFGETRPSGANSPLGHWKNFFMAYLLGRSLVAMRAEDALVSARWLAEAAGDRRKVRLIGIGEAGVPALHAAALESDLFSSVLLRRTLVNWESVVRTPESANQFANVIHGALVVYDLPDLISLIGRDKMTIEKPLDAAGKPYGE